MNRVIPLFGAGLRSLSRTLTAQERENVYYNPTVDGDKSPFGMFGTPGLSETLRFSGVDLARGAISIETRAFAVQGASFWEISVGFATTLRGSLLTSSGRVSIASNGVQLMIVDGTAGYIFDLALNTLTQITDPSFPSNPTTVTFQDGFFLVSFREDTINKSRIFINETPYDGLSWDALDFRNAEVSPDGVVRVYCINGQAVVLGDLSTEFWGYSGDSFPFTPIRGTALQVGLAARYSLAEFPDGLCFLGRSALGQVQVYLLKGYQIGEISTPDLTNILNGYAVTSDAIGYSYMWNSHPFYVIAFPTAGETWLYDGLATAAVGAPMWSRLTSGYGRHLSDVFLRFADKNYVFAFDAPVLYRIDANAYQDGDLFQRCSVTSKHLNNNLNYTNVNSIQADFETGVGLTTGQGEDPVCWLEVSRDNGRTWGIQMEAPLGKIGEYKTQVEWRRLGISEDFVFRISRTDPVKFAMTSVAIDVDDE